MMELGQRIRQARLEAGLSQRQLCGDRITRNMLSQIENGSAKPSMDTLRFLAAQLDKPVGCFLEEQPPVALPNLELMTQLRQAQGRQVLQLLKQYRGPDPVFDPERWLLEAQTCLALARQALQEDKTDYARQLLEQAARAGESTPYYTQALERERLLLCGQAGLPVTLPSLDEELLLRARLAPQSQKKSLLAAVQTPTDQWYFLQGQLARQEGRWQEAIGLYLQARDYDPRQCYSALEQCYRQLEDYKQAYEYACKLRQLTDG